ncbi:biotin-dependent carboxyltransferase family protein [Gloeomargaritales cyanobacterium VI4D9]|nr:biotin-dependent carboxyltransferase family protein [Gloeomargaritales cyanobacterium VI4D9]
MSIDVQEAGLLSTVQDLGRWGMQHLGIAPTGAMDTCASTLANWLVGNDAAAAVLEMTLVGATLQFEADTLMALCGGKFSATVNGRPLPLYRPVLVSAGSQVACGRAEVGARLYLAVSGGIDVPKVMNSHSTNLTARFGGMEGRALQRGDRLYIGKSSPQAQKLIATLKAQGKGKAIATTPFFISPTICHIPTSPLVVRVVLTEEFKQLKSESHIQFFQSPFTVSAHSNRMGYRLSGKPLEFQHYEEQLSSGTVNGAIQLPPNGQPIILLADRQTVGGYPIIAVVASVDLPKVAQAKVNTQIYFQAIALQEAQELYRAQQRAMRLCKAHLDLKLNML